MNRNLIAAASIAPAIALVSSSCFHHSVDTTSEVKPIHIVIDINLKVEKEMDKYFGEQAAQANASEAKKPAGRPTPAKVPLADALKPVALETLPPREIMMGRFEVRRTPIDELKAKGVVGEDAKGYLQYVGDAKESEELIAAENADRKLIYQLAAKRQNSTPERAATLKAAKNAEKARPGDYIQDADGKWSRKSAN